MSPAATTARRAGRAARLGGLACLVMGLAGCTPQVQPAEEAVAPEPHDQVPEATGLSTEQDPTMPNGDPSQLPPEPLLAPVLADAGKRSGMATGELVVTGSWRRTWSDGSLGCPQPGMHYTQALVPGWQVIVTAGNRTLDYRLSDRGYFFLCPGGTAGGVELRLER